MDGLEEQLVAVRPFGGSLLQREQLVRPEVALVVAGAEAGEDRREVVGALGHAGHGSNAMGRSILSRVSDLFSDAAGERLSDSAPLASAF